MSTVLACDLGGSSFRAALIDAQGATLAESAVSGPAHLDDAGHSEIDASAWWTSLIEVAGHLASQAPEPFSQIKAVAICGITRTQVFLGHDGRPLRPAMTWKDTRSDAVASRLRDTLGAHPEAPQVNAFHPLARLAWLREDDATAFASLACVLEPKDYLNFRLTGRRAGDAVSMARLLASAADCAGQSALAAAGIPARILPPALEAHDKVGPVLVGLPAPFDRLAGLPVFCCSNDTWTAVTGLGAMRAGHAYNISGTTEVLGLMCDRAAAAEGLLTVDWRGLWQLGGPSQNGADTVSWLLAVLGQDAAGSIGASIDALLAGERQSQPVLFLPYLQGERVPYWNPSLRGAFLGLNRRHAATDLAYAVLEGVAFLNRIVLETAEAALGEAASAIHFGGGAAANPLWCQIKADICGRPILVGAAREPGLLGAAIVAWTGLGRFGSLAEAQQRLATVAHRYEPDPQRRADYDILFALYRQAETALAPVSTGLASASITATALSAHRTSSATEQTPAAAPAARQKST